MALVQDVMPQAESYNYCRKLRGDSESTIV